MKNYSDMISIIEELSKHTDKYYIYVSGWLTSLEVIDPEWYNKDYTKDVYGAFPKLKEIDDESDASNIFNDYIVIEFDTEEEMNKVFYNIVGDDGNSLNYSYCTNDYAGPCTVYAITIYGGTAHNENT